VLSRTTPIDLSYRTIHRLVQQALAHSQDAADHETTCFEETGELKHSEGREVDRVIIEADGVVLPLQRETSRKAEVKLGIAYGYRRQHRQVDGEKQGNRSHNELRLLNLTQCEITSNIWAIRITSLGRTTKISNQDSGIMFCRVSLTQNRQICHSNQI